MRKTLLGVLAALAAAALPQGAAAQAEGPPAPWTTLREIAPLPPVKESGRQKVGDVELYYAVYGEGPPVILLHPGLGSGDYWANQIGPLSHAYEVTVVDMRGHGRSAASREPLSYALMAADIVHFIKSRKIRAPAIIGWGDGAVVGLEIARRYPKRIGKLIAFGLTYDKSGLQPAPDRTATFTQYVHKAMADHQRLSETPGAFEITFDQLESLWEREPAYTAADLAKVKTPTTIMIAEYDEWVKPAHMQEAGKLIPEAKIVVIPKVSHFAPWQASKRFNDALRLVLAD